MTHGQVGGVPWFKLRFQEHARRTFLRPGPLDAGPAPTCWAARLGLAPIRQSIMILMARRNGEAQGGRRVDAHKLPCQGDLPGCA